MLFSILVRAHLCDRIRCMPRAVASKQTTSNKIRFGLNSEMRCQDPLKHYCENCSAASVSSRAVISLIIGLFVFSLAEQASAQSCPDLSFYYPAAESDWAEVDRRLDPLLEDCLTSAEYFALRGAAQLNTGQLPAALESLERALLLEPANGAAQIDYALALFEAGQLFTALEVNERLLARTDLPATLRPALRARHSNWRALTRQNELQLDVLAGYDTNLNAAPANDRLTLTLTGEPVLLELDPEFQPINGPYVNLRVGGRYRQLAPGSQHNFSADLRGRISEDTKSDIVQFGARYAFIRPDPKNAWQIEAGINHLFFGGSALFTGSEAGLRYQPAGDDRCRPEFAVTLQHQHFHDQADLNALESKASAGGSCQIPAFGSMAGIQRIAFEMALLGNDNLENGRLGGDRSGWQLNFNWQHPVGAGSLRTQLNHTRLHDSSGYSPLLANHAVRWQNRSYVLFQYRESVSVLNQDSILMINLYHQQQQSNIELFQTVDTTIEVGFSFRF